MAKQVLPTNFMDDILNESMNGKRRWTITQNDDGTYTLEDATTYDQLGNTFGQAQVNEMNKAINESVDQARVIDDYKTLAAVNQNGFVPGAKPVAQLISDLGGLSFGQDADGSWGYRIGGADPVIPFKSSKVAMGGFKFLGNNGNPNGATVDVGFKPDFIMYGFLGGSDITKAFYNGNSGNDRTLVLWWDELQKEFIWDSASSNPPKCIRRSFPTGPSTGNRLALQEVTDTGFKIYGGYGSGAAFYVCIKLE